MRIALLIGNIVNAFILAIVFYLVIMPMGLFMRLLRKDPLRLKLDRQVKTYREKSELKPKNHVERPF